MEREWRRRTGNMRLRWDYASGGGGRSGRKRLVGMRGGSSLDKLGCGGREGSKRKWEFYVGVVTCLAGLAAERCACVER